MPTNKDDVTIEHVLNSLYQIESWTRKIRYVLGEMDPETVVVKASEETVETMSLELGPPRVRSDCPPPEGDDGSEDDDRHPGKGKGHDKGKGKGHDKHGKDKDKDKDKKDKKKNKKKDR